MGTRYLFVVNGMVKCEICGREIAPLHEHEFPADIQEEKTFCVCIPWETMEKCIELSLDNAQRLVEDAECLLKAGLLSSAKVLTVFSLEESGKALLACEYLAERKKASVKDYKSKFLKHPIKIDKALKAIEEINVQHARIRKAIWGDFAKELRAETLDAIFVNYDGRIRMWSIPWVRDPRSLVKAWDGFIDLKTAKGIREAQEPIDKLFTEMLIKDAKVAIYRARQKREKIEIP